MKRREIQPPAELEVFISNLASRVITFARKDFNAFAAMTGWNWTHLDRYFRLAISEAVVQALDRRKKLESIEEFESWCLQRITLSPRDLWSTERRQTPAEELVKRPEKRKRKRA